ncbi:hypothetical protein D187_004768 [Cystobacter fuscus DSM 2262]|uniref:Uncharacterized protein n=1 Tax=Cystobacter fuscus (strain ATCC 25194 / DSM 2262 / NBRC 100088 / M29) TaxID=1242864 RepID=S9QMJ5_CYSF2|nr:hypothetical protein D187_004768 [Cystobacter fuscus DSM 2262]
MLTGGGMVLDQQKLLHGPASVHTRPALHQAALTLASTRSTANGPLGRPPRKQAHPGRVRRIR